MSIWLLPENIADMLPREARAIEKLRKQFLELVSSHGFEIVKPPMIEYVDSLLTGTGSDLDLRTFKIVDQASGRLMGLRADMTPQVARIDAHILNRPGITRLCYAGSLLHARPLHPMASRQPYVVGVEMFGSKSLRSDLEIMSLALASLKTLELKDVHLDIGHVAVVRAILASDTGCQAVMEKILYALSHKDVAALSALSGQLKPQTIDALIKLTRLFGGIEVLDKIKEELSAYPEVQETIEEVRWLAQHCGADKISFDFADVHGYQYLTGITFSVSVPGCCQAILRGGRYDSIGAKFGKNRPAVGFTIYLREIVSLLDTRRPYAVMAPADVDNAELAAKVAQLRDEGKIVVQLLPEDCVKSLEESFRLDEELVFENGQWQLVSRFLK